MSGQQQKPPQRVRLGDVVVNAGLVTRDQVAEALEYQKLWGHRLGTALVAKKFITEYELIDVLAKELRLETADPLDLEIHPDVLALIPKQLAAANDLIPIAVDERNGLRRIVIVMADPLNIEAISAVRAHCRMDVLPVIGAMSSVAKAIHQRYGITAAVNKVSAYADGEMIIVHKGGDEVMLGADGKRGQRLAAAHDPFAHLQNESTAPGARPPDDTTHVPAKLQYPGQTPPAPAPAAPAQDVSTWRPPALQYPQSPPAYPPQQPAYPPQMPAYSAPMYPASPGYVPPLPAYPAYPAQTAQLGGYGPAAATFVPQQPPGFAPPAPQPTMQQPSRPPALTPPPASAAPAPISLAMMEELSGFSPKELLLAVIRVLIKRRIIPGEELLDELKRRG